MFESDDFGLDDDEIFERAVTSTQNIPKKTNTDKKPLREVYTTNSKVIQRKFPGPAGLLPEQFNPAGETLGGNICSQKSHGVFETDQWVSMCRDFKGETFLPHVYTVQWIKSRALSKSLINQKAPFLAAVIKNIETFCGKNSFGLVLKDATGEIRATILQELFDRYLNELTVGSVIVLKQFSVLTINNASYLNITLNNLIRIYSADKTTEVQHLTTEDLIKSVNESERNNTQNNDRHRHTITKETFALPSPKVNKRCLPSVPHATEDKPKKFKFEHKLNEHLIEDALEGLNPDSLFEDF